MRRSALLLPLFLLMTGGADATAQSTKMPSTLRYGSGLLDVPVASVLPHLGILANYSGVSVDVPARPAVGPEGAITGDDGPWTPWLSDGSLAVGLWNRVEVGTTLQSFESSARGGTMAGLFGRLLLLDPGERDGLGLAVGARWVTSPSFADAGGGEARPGRLGFADERLRADYGSVPAGVATNLSPYVVASALLPGFDLRFVPDHDLTFVLGRGGGMFSAGSQLPWYAAADSDGWFIGSAAHFELRDHLLLNLAGEYSGFDVNLGAALDAGGIRLGAFLLGVNYRSPVSAYRSRKWGLSASVAICPRQGGLCDAELRDRSAPDTIQLPPPPPDTVIVDGDARSSGFGSDGVPAHDPVRGVEGGEGGAVGGSRVRTGVGADEVVLAVGRRAAGGDDDHPGIEDPHGLGAHQIQLQAPVGGLLDGLEGRAGGRPYLTLERLRTFDLRLEDATLGPLEGDVDAATSVRELLLLELREAETGAALRLRSHDDSGSEWMRADPSTTDSR